jgi:hypothetical protein
MRGIQRWNIRYENKQNFADVAIARLHREPR